MLIIYPVGSWPICDPWSAVEFVENLNSDDDCGRQCLQSCTETVYETTLTSARFRCKLPYFLVKVKL